MYRRISGNAFNEYEENLMVYLLIEKGESLGNIAEIITSISGIPRKEYAIKTKLNILAGDKFKNIKNIFEYIEIAFQKKNKPLQEEEIDKIIKDFEEHFGIDDSAGNNQVMVQNLNPNNQITTQNLGQAIENFGNYQNQQQNIPFQQGNIPFQQGNMPFQQGNIPFQQGNMPFQQGNMPYQQQNMPFQQGNIPFQQGNFGNYQYQQPNMPPFQPLPPIQTIFDLVEQKRGHSI